MVKNIVVKNLSVGFPTKQGVVQAVDDVSVVFQEGKFTAIIGESGCGKSVLGQALMGMLPNYVVLQGSVLYGNLKASAEVFLQNKIYGRELGIVPQNPSASLNPTRKLKKQFDDLLEAHGVFDKDDSIKKHWLHFFALDDADRVLVSYPDELSGGMQQRFLCALAMSLEPKWILADEPTKGLDEETCSIVLENLLKIKELGSVSMVIITHDVKLARNVCDKTCVMYAGQMVEQGTDVFNTPVHPYTKSYMQALPENGFKPLWGRAPNLSDALQGCKFAPRCMFASEICRQAVPETKISPHGEVRCHHA
ncbi:MAG: ABC transporter ATP-binding protein [Phascolarctobacterium sp.]|nr:ABC transporter ATP-binding protein [Phascolarctobacterium sp.]